MANVRNYSLWLQHINCGKQSKNGQMAVSNFFFASSTNSSFGAGGAGAGKAKFDTLHVSVTEECAFPYLFNASHSGANVGRGRLNAIMNSGASRQVLEFEDALIAFAKPQNPGIDSPATMDLTISMLNPRILWAGN